MSNLQDLFDEEEMSYQFAMMNIKIAIDLYGMDILKDALSSYYASNLTNAVIPDTMLVQ
jgi:hypothetical protein